MEFRSTQSRELEPKLLREKKEPFMRALTVLCLVAATLAFANVAHAAESAWMTNYAQALELAKKDGKPVLVDFTGSDWCPWCIKLHNEIFETKEFKDWAAGKVVLVELDFPRKSAQAAELKKQNAELQKKYDIKGFPTVIVLNANGEKIGQSGYQQGGPGPWIKNIETITAAK